MNLSDFSYDLPEDLIAQTPIEKEIIQSLWF